MNDHARSLALLAELAAEGARLFGDDPRRIDAHVEAALSGRTAAEREAVRRALAMLAQRHGGGGPH